MISYKKRENNYLLKIIKIKIKRLSRNIVRFPLKKIKRLLLEKKTFLEQQVEFFSGYKVINFIDSLMCGSLLLVLTKILYLLVFGIQLFPQYNLLLLLCYSFISLKLGLVFYVKKEFRLFFRRVLGERYVEIMDCPSHEHYDNAHLNFENPEITKEEYLKIPKITIFLFESLIQIRLLIMSEIYTFIVLNYIFLYFLLFNKLLFLAYFYTLFFSITRITLLMTDDKYSEILLFVAETFSEPELLKDKVLRGTRKNAKLISLWIIRSINDEYYEEYNEYRNDKHGIRLLNSSTRCYYLIKLEEKWNFRTAEVEIEKKKGNKILKYLIIICVIYIIYKYNTNNLEQIKEMLPKDIITATKWFKNTKRLTAKKISGKNEQVVSNNKYYSKKAKEHPFYTYENEDYNALISSNTARDNPTKCLTMAFPEKYVALSEYKLFLNTITFGWKKNSHNGLVISEFNKREDISWKPKCEIIIEEKKLLILNGNNIEKLIERNTTIKKYLSFNFSELHNFIFPDLLKNSLWAPFCHETYNKENLRQVLSEFETSRAIFNDVLIKNVVCNEDIYFKQFILENIELLSNIIIELKTQPETFVISYETPISKKEIEDLFFLLNENKGITTCQTLQESLVNNIIENSKHATEIPFLNPIKKFDITKNMSEKEKTEFDFHLLMTDKQLKEIYGYQISENVKNAVSQLQIEKEIKKTMVKKSYVIEELQEKNKKKTQATIDDLD